MLTLKAILVEHVWVEERANFFIVALQALQDQKRGDDEEDLSLPALQLFRELLMLFARGFNDRRKMNELVTLFTIHEVGESLRPCVLELHEDLYQFNIVLKLWVNHLNILLVFFK